MGLPEKITGPVFFKDSSDAETQLEQLQKLYKTAPDHIKKQVEQDIKMLEYGIYGEKQIAFELMNSFMPMLILHDLHIQYEGLSAQIDYLVITRKLIIVIECKNLIGNIEVTSNGEFIRTTEFGGKKRREGIYSPITQNRRHLDLLRKIRLDLQSNIIMRTIVDKGFDDWHKSIVVLANPKTIINMKYAKKDVKEQIIRGDQLVDYIKKLDRESKELRDSDKNMYARAEQFLSLHTPNTTDYTKKYGLNDQQDISAKPIADAHEEVAPAASPSTDNLEELPIYQALRQFRYEQSREEKVKAYYIYNNAQMEELIRLMPKSLEDIKGISGFGEVKCHKYGAEILAIIDKFR